MAIIHRQNYASPNLPKQANAVIAGHCCMLRKQHVRNRQVPQQGGHQVAQAACRLPIARIPQEQDLPQIAALSSVNAIPTALFHKYPCSRC